jgi:hypothetical protein
MPNHPYPPRQANAAGSSTDQAHHAFADAPYVSPHHYWKEFHEHFSKNNQPDSYFNLGIRHNSEVFPCKFAFAIGLFRSYRLFCDIVGIDPFVACGMAAATTETAY